MLYGLLKLKKKQEAISIPDVQLRGCAGDWQGGMKLCGRVGLGVEE